MRPSRRVVAPFGAMALWACLAGAAVAAVPAPRDVPYPGVLRIAVDATDVDRRIVHVRETLTAPPEDLVLYYPKWIPGQHEIGRAHV